MKKNIGKVDRIARILLGSAIIIVGANMNSVFGVLGIIPIVSSQIGFCPLYTLLGINTNSKELERIKK